MALTAHFRQLSVHHEWKGMIASHYCSFTLKLKPFCALCIQTKVIGMQQLKEEKPISWQDVFGPKYPSM